MGAGFSADTQARIDAVPPPPPGAVLDCVLRVASPTATGFEPGQKTLTFMVTEVGMAPECFDSAEVDRPAFTREANRIITPSAWSRDRLAEYGFDGERIDVVPHGVDSALFRPMAAGERLLARRLLGVEADEVLFVNVGVAMWNKGLDLLIRAFAAVRRANPRARLLLKDHPTMYRLGVDRTIAELSRQHPGLLDEQVLSGISVVSASLDLPQMRALYAVADAYVSPYRAEGFNLPVLEAMACGAPVIVTAGGPTDDFCRDAPALAQRLPATLRRAEETTQMTGWYLEPELAPLVDAMQAVAAGDWPRTGEAAAQQRAALLRDFAWPAVADRLQALF
jgi:glycosyltransferase involved in cell wall biosynthesis